MRRFLILGVLGILYMFKGVVGQRLDILSKSKYTKAGYTRVVIVESKYTKVKAVITKFKYTKVEVVILRVEL